MPKPRRLLVISQVYVPDAMAVGQHVADLAEEMARRGWEVRVLTSARGYDDPSLRFPACEVRNGVSIRRLPLSSFGKRSIAVRLVAQSLFLLQAVARGLFMPGLTAVLVSTSPPFAGFGAAMLNLFRGVPFLWWVMDVNPDQMVAAGRLPATSLLVRAFDWTNRVTLRRAARVVALDTFMAERLDRKRPVGDRLAVAPPWSPSPPPDDAAGFARLDALGRGFRDRQGWSDRFVVMYSGNHAIQHPLDTLLAAASRLEDDHRILFAFVGGGAGKAAVERRIAAGATNIVSLPYQPLESLDESLTAADLHVVSMGDDVVGIVHPSKIYGAMAVGRPILFFGPRRSHAGEIVEPRRIGWRLDHGDIEGTVAAIRAAAAMPAEECLAMGRAAASVIKADFPRAALLGRMAALVEAMGHGGA